MSRTPHQPPRVLIGSLSRGDVGPIPTVTRAFIDGLGVKYAFTVHWANRRFGRTNLAQFTPLNLYYLLKHYFLWLWKLVTGRPDIAHYPVTSYWNLEKSLLFLSTARKMHVRTVGHLHGGLFVEFWKTLSPGRKRRAFSVLNRLDAFVVLSNGWKDEVAREVGIDTQRIHVVNNPIDRQFETQAAMFPVERRSGPVFSLGIMARQKGVFDIIETAKILSSQNNVRFSLVGPEREEGTARACTELVASYGLGHVISFRKGVWGDEKLGLFRDAMIFLFPSYVENFPLVILEAAASGLPIVATEVGATKEFFAHNESILYVEPGNVAQIAGAVGVLLRDASLRRRLGENARAVFRQRLSRERIMDSLDVVYDRVLRVPHAGS
jgi:glycosyltransferase involved in cell wall biosynthesis